VRFSIGLLFTIAIIAALSAATASAGQITNLFDTGVGSNGVSLPDGTSPDPHYTIASGSDGSIASATTVKTSASGYPVGPWWTGDSPTSAWIMPTAGYPGNYLPVGDYDYVTTFTLPSGANSVSISFNLATDDAGPAVLLNGLQVAGPQYAPLFAYTPIDFTSSNIFAGTNTLTFVVYNSNPSPTGLRIDGISGTFTTIPEPPTAALFLSLCVFLGLRIIGRNRKRICQTNIKAIPASK
jgi:hypothetical protein